MVTASTKHVMAAVLISLLLLSSAAASQASLYDRPKERVPLPSPIGYVSDHAQVVEPKHMISVLMRVKHRMHEADPLAQELFPYIRRRVDQ